MLLGTIGTASAGHLVARTHLLEQHVGGDGLFGFNETFQGETDATAFGQTFARADFRELRFKIVVEADGSHCVTIKCNTRVLHYAGRAIASAIELLLNHKELTLQDADTVALALNRFRGRPSLGFSDCLVLEIARKAGHLPLGTFDRNLARLEGVRRL